MHTCSYISIDRFEYDINTVSNSEKAEVYFTLAMSFILSIINVTCVGYNSILISEILTEEFNFPIINPIMAFLFGVYVYYFITKHSFFNYIPINVNDVFYNQFVYNMCTVSTYIMLTNISI